MIALLVIRLFFDPVVVEVVFIEHISHQASQPVRCDFKSQPMQPILRVFPLRKPCLALLANT